MRYLERYARVLSIMTWNWQLPDWPEFTWDQARLTRAETLFAEGAGMVIGSSRHLDDTSRETLVVDIMSVDALATSAIEGEISTVTAFSPRYGDSSVSPVIGAASARRRPGSPR